MKDEKPADRRFLRGDSTFILASRRGVPAFKQDVGEGRMGYERCVAAPGRGGRGSDCRGMSVPSPDRVRRAQAPRGV